MKWEYTILYGVWVISVLMLIFVPRDKRCVSQIVFFFKQMVTWVVGLIVVERGWIEYPVRFFSDVNRSSFTFEFMAYPAVCGMFNAYYPAKRSLLFRGGYYILYCTVMTVMEVVIEKYTELIRYVHWNWYWTWITLMVTFMMSRRFCVWYFSVRPSSLSSARKGH
ncbi:CBO0543 family protein [Paenibacillus aestuarii]|uniref:CBO0543 family protein n=1 Tax=Paenibacillus aestuarii TaxID=516965 RepID=A0ABW0K8U7_9BACL|nr:CBO0543 family protein [Paenibacillus aestuarii]